MSQLDKLKLVLGNPTGIDSLLQYYLDNASDIICDIRNSDVVETKYLNAQVQMAVEMYSKVGTEGQIAHNENGISRTYEASDISPTLLARITPFAKTPYSEIRVVTP